MIGDNNDVTSRLESVLPPWFGNGDTPYLDNLLAAYAAVGSQLYSQFAYEQLQTRILTATDTNLDAIAVDFFGVNGLSRFLGESDAQYRNRILAYLLIEKGTLNGMYLALTLLTGNRPQITVPGLPLTDGGYVIGGCGYNVSGCYSSLIPSYTNYQCFIKVYTNANAENIDTSTSGWNIVQAAWGGELSNFVWGSGNGIVFTTQAEAIYAAINNTKPEGSTCWVAIINTSPP